MILFFFLLLTHDDQSMQADEVNEWVCGVHTYVRSYNYIMLHLIIFNFHLSIGSHKIRNLLVSSLHSAALIMTMIMNKFQFIKLWTKYVIRHPKFYDCVYKCGGSSSDFRFSIKCTKKTMWEKRSLKNQISINNSESIALQMRRTFHFVLENWMHQIQFYFV